MPVRVLADAAGTVGWCQQCGHGDTVDSRPLTTMDFAPLLRRLLGERGVTQGALADLLGINRVGIARMAIGQRTATPEMCERIGDALHLMDIERYAFALAAVRAKGYKV